MRKLSHRNVNNLPQSLARERLRVKPRPRGLRVCPNSFTMLHFPFLQLSHERQQDPWSVLNSPQPQTAGRSVKPHKRPGRGTWMGRSLQAAVKHDDHTETKARQPDSMLLTPFGSYHPTRKRCLSVFGLL